MEEKNLYGGLPANAPQTGSAHMCGAPAGGTIA